MSDAPFDVVWSDDAQEDFDRLTFDEATAVARAVGRFAMTGEGHMIPVGPSEYLLLVGSLAVVMLIPSGERIYVDRVRHA